MWTGDISSIVFTRVKAQVGEKLRSEYPNIFFTTSDRTRDDPLFPAVYIHEMGSMETGQDLEGSEINAVFSTFQIEVSDNESQNRVAAVMDEVVRSMKKMRFSVVSMPEFQNQQSVYRQVARFRRVIGRGDIL